MHLQLHHYPSYSLVAAEGSLDGTNIEAVLDVFSLVPVEQSLVIDVRGVAAVDVVAAKALVDEVAPRARVANVTVVVDELGVASTLVMEDLHHLAPLFRNVDDAVALVTGASV